MYKILLLKRLNDSLWSTYKEQSEEDSTEKVDFETDDLEVLESKIKELLQIIPKNQIKPIRDMSFELDIIINEDGVII